jgi:hypothetical protein
MSLAKRGDLWQVKIKFMPWANFLTALIQLKYQWAIHLKSIC